MRYLTLLGAVATVALAGPAHAGERMSVSEVHSFIAGLNTAINSPSLLDSRNQLDRLIASHASFENNVNATVLPHHTWVNNAYYYNNYAYRYPYAAHPYAKTGFQAMGKWDNISLIETKKRTIPGYKAQFELGSLTMSPMADTAVVDVDLKEFSLTYAAGYAPYYYTHSNLNGHSKCKMYISKDNKRVALDRLYCNTNTNLPL
ncbi:MAG: hypothetical protein GW903_00510 [Alphaproteobacteria bacterium]|nr:hypothetical protein [Alphaproteobacteria bacterium]NCQ87452.1 hypothetical protein [Alphaproteobacteria bacterium]NCT06323.1 hypothetical protein [Alphaproteobacteria bacterium]